MPFDNDDLKRLKETTYNEAEDKAYTGISVKRLKALIGRLEAAEACLIDSGIAEEKCHYDHHGNCQAHFVSDPCPVKAWRKAAGNHNA